MRATLAAVLLSLLVHSQLAPAQDGPPKEPGPFRPPDLVELKTLDPTIKLDIRYATSNNLAGRAVYAEARAFLQRPAADALLRAHRSLRPDGFGLLVFDGYRPWRVTKLFWDVTPPEKHEFVADPAKGSKHNRGCAVDLSLYDLKSGKEIEMPSVYDEMSPRAYPEYAGGTPRPRHVATACAARWRPRASPSSPTSGGTSTTRTGRSIRFSMCPFDAIHSAPGASAPRGKG